MGDSSEKDMKAGLRRVRDKSDPSWMNIKVENDAGKQIKYRVQGFTLIKKIHKAFITDTAELLRTEVYFKGAKAEENSTMNSMGVKESDRLEVRRIVDVKKEVEDGKDTKPIPIISADGLSAKYRLLPTDFLRLILNDFKNKHISPTAVVKFRFNGVPIAQDDTPGTLGMDDKEENEIEAFEPQKGGSKD